MNSEAAGRGADEELWSAMEPGLDELVERLRPQDRDALLLRHFCLVLLRFLRLLWLSFSCAFCELIEVRHRNTRVFCLLHSLPRLLHLALELLDLD